MLSSDFKWVICMTTRGYLMLTSFISQQELSNHSEESKITFRTLFSLEKVAEVSEHRSQPSLPTTFLFWGERSAFWLLFGSNNHTAIYLLSYSNKTRLINKHNGSENNALMTQEDCTIVYGTRFLPSPFTFWVGHKTLLKFYFLAGN